ncbi:hypothetical protein O9992_18075 [Vibrio lentus]|nr:hypothetical protein [Vibrio lentus]
MVSQWIMKGKEFWLKKVRVKMSSNKDLYLAFRGQDLEALRCRSVQKMSRRDLESQIQAAVDLLANSYQRPITSMMQLWLGEKPD